MKKTRILSTMLAAVVCMASLPAINVFAANQQRTATLDLTAAEFKNDQKNDDEGWSWDAATSTLTLDNVDFSTGNNESILTDGKKSMTILFKGENKLTSSGNIIARNNKSSKDSVLTFKGEKKESKLNLVQTGNLTAMDQSNVTFESGTVDIKGGAVATLYTIKVMEATVHVNTVDVDPKHGWNDGLYANGSIEIYGGEVNVNAGRIGLFVVGIGAAESKTGLKIEGGKLDIEGGTSAMYLGMSNTKNGIISGGDITLKGNVGIFINNSEKCQITGGTFHIDDCDNPFVVHKNSSGVFEIAPADYTEVDKAVEAAKALNKDNYVDFTGVETAIEAVDKTKNFIEQADVDKMAKDINDAVAALVYKSADYTEVDKAEKAAKALNKDDYEDFSAVEKALEAIDRTKNITEQADVDAMAKAINDAIANLVKKAPTDSSQPDSENSSDNSSDVSSSSAVDSDNSSSADSKATDSKSDSSSKAASNASNTNPSTGVAGGAFALALLSGAAVVVAKKKNK